MNTISKSLGILAFAIMMPFTASAAMAAQAPDVLPSTLSAQKALTTTSIAQNAGLVEKSVAPKTIKVTRRWRRGRGRGLAVGIIAGAAAAAILSGAARSRSYRSDYEYSGYSSRRHSNRCDRWAYRCDCGIRRACRKYYRNCE